MVSQGKALIKRAEYALWLLGVLILAVYFLLLGQNSQAQNQAADEFAEAKRTLQASQTSPAAVEAPAQNSEVIIAALAASASDLPPTKEFNVDADQSDKSLWSDAFIGHYENAVAKGGDSAIAQLKIPSVDLDVAVFDGADKHNLNRGAARILSTGLVSEDNRIGIAGHRDGWFRPLKDIEIGDVIELETLTETRRYQINKTHIVTPSDVGILDGDDDTLVLVTCYPFYFVGSAPQRFIVEAVRLTN